MLPVLEAALQNAGHTLAVGELDAAVVLATAKYSAATLMLGSGDFSGYKHFSGSRARRMGGANNYAGAEDAYRHALDIETRLFGADSLAVGETLAELALQVSNQGQASRRSRGPVPPGLADHRSSSASAPRRARALRPTRRLMPPTSAILDDALKFARAATAMRRAEVDAAKVASVSDDANSGELTAPVTLEGELAHSLRIEAEMALRLGDNASAQAAAEEALWIITEEPGLPLWWRPEIDLAYGRSECGARPRRRRRA